MIKCQVLNCPRPAKHELGGCFICNYHEDRFYTKMRNQGRRMGRDTSVWGKNKLYGKKIDVTRLDTIIDEALRTKKTKIKEVED